jgi:8-oxo-dGTP diphosphatase
MAGVAARLWWAMRGRWQWYLLWLLQAKFIVGVTGVIIDDRGRVLLQRHRFWQPSSWGLPSGYVKRKETLEQALRREVREETGLEIVVERLLRVGSGHRLRLEVAYQGRATGGELRLDEREVLEARFFTPRDLPYGLIAAHRDLIRLGLLPPEGLRADT